MTILFKTPVSIGASKVVIEGFAEQVAKMFDFKPGGSLEELVATNGGKIVFGSSGEEDEESGSIIANSLSDYTIYLSPNTSRLRDRFTIAHELGHLFLHFPKIRKTTPNAVMRATRWIDGTNPSQQRAEMEANWFAAAFLMPADEFRKVYNSQGPSRAKEIFDVSRAAASTRANALGLP